MVARETSSTGKIDIEELFLKLPVSAHLLPGGFPFSTVLFGTHTPLDASSRAPRAGRSARGKKILRA